MKRLSRWIVPGLLMLGLVGCGPPKKSIFPPMVSVQELHVQDDGSWRMQLRIQNNSYAAMDFRSAHLVMKMGDHDAGTIDTAIGMEIPPLSVDIADVQLMPSPAAAKALQAIGKGGANAASYTLDGTVSAIPDKEDKARPFEAQGKDWLSPVPGIPDTFR